MKILKNFLKTFYGKIIGVTLVILAIFPLYFRFVGPIPFSVTQTTVEKVATFDVSAEGKITAIPDTAEINLGIQISKPTVEAAQREANETIDKITSQIKKLGIEEKYLKTTNYSVYPNYDYRAGQRIVGYNVNIILRVKVKDFDKINQVIDIATTSGVNQIGQLNFTIDEEKLEQLKMEARKQAIEKGKNKAKEIASAGGLRLGRIVNISENVVSPFPQTQYMLEKAVGGEEPQPSTQIQPGESEITISVTLSYETL